MATCRFTNKIIINNITQRLCTALGAWGAAAAGPRRVAMEAGLKCLVPPPALCTDNGAMIAWAGIERWRRGMSDGLDFAARPRWPLDETAAKPGARA